jgi:uncharacterized protein YlxW (UPF0749 family)
MERMTEMSTSRRVLPHERADESMSLLVDIAAQALDPSYAAAAARRDPANPRRPTRPAALLTAAGVLAATLVVVVAGVQAHQDAPAESRSRDVLVGRVEARGDSVAALQRRLTQLRASTGELRDRLLATSAAGDELAGRLAVAELLAGTVAVRGPGLRVVLDDAPDASADNRVLDRDVQTVVNGLWAAGAEAIAINGERLTAQTAVRQAGGTILVNFDPVAAPYVIEAIGDPVEVETSFGAGAAAARMRNLSQLYGLHFTYTRTEEMTLPAASGIALRHARPLADTGERR